MVISGLKNPKNKGIINNEFKAKKKEKKTFTCNLVQFDGLNCYIYIYMYSLHQGTVFRRMRSLQYENMYVSLPQHYGDLPC